MDKNDIKANSLDLKQKAASLGEKAKDVISGVHISAAVDKAKEFASKENFGKMATKAKCIATDANLNAMKERAKSFVSKDNYVKLKEAVSSLKDSEGRKAFADTFRSLPSKMKVIVVCGMLLALLILFKCCTGVVGMVSGDRISSNGVNVDLSKYSDEYFGNVFLGSTEVPIGTLYEFGGDSSIRILSVLESGVLVHYEQGHVPMFGQVEIDIENAFRKMGMGGYDKVIYIETDPSGYTDGNELKEGLCVRTGSYRYQSKGGVRMVEAYADVTSDDLKSKLADYKKKRSEDKAKKLMSSEGKALDVDVDIKSICGFVIGGTPSQNWHLFAKSKHTPYYHEKGYQQYRQTGALINPFRQFKEAKATYTFYDGVPEHLYEVELETEHFDMRLVMKELENVKSLLEKKFNIKMEDDPHPGYSSLKAYIWEGNKGEVLRILETGTRLRIILCSRVIDSKDQFEADKKKKKEEEGKILPANQGIEAL